MIKADFENARKGDKVRCLSGFRGEIIEKTEDKIKIQTGFEVVSINLCGTFYCDDANEVSSPFWFYDFPDQFPTEEHCKRPLPKIEVDEKVLVYFEGEWYREHFKAYNSYGDVLVHGKGRSSWTNLGKFTSLPRFWKLASDETINSGNLEELKDEKQAKRDI